MHLSERVGRWVAGVDPPATASGGGGGDAAAASFTRAYARQFAQAYSRGTRNLWKRGDAGEGKGGEESNLIASSSIVLSRSEQKLNTHGLATEIARLSHDFPSTALGYEDYKGSLALREAVCRYANRTFLQRSQRQRAAAISADEVCVSAGCGSVLENMFLALCDEGDYALVPAPYYASFDRDLGMRAGVRIGCVDTEAGGRLSAAAFERHYQNLARRGERPRVVLLTNPHNPLGIVYSTEELAEVLRWAEKRQLHLISDEIYANSIYGRGGSSEAESEESPPSTFVSVINLISGCSADDLGVSPAYLRDYVHATFGFSKDFGASGLR